IIGREIFGGEAARSPHVGDRVDGPGGMQSYDYAYEDSPEQERQASDGEQDYAKNDVRAVVILRQPDVDLIFREVGDVARKSSRVVMHGAAGQDPSHVRPPFAVAGRVRIAMLVGVLVMNAMGR